MPIHSATQSNEGPWPIGQQAVPSGLPRGTERNLNQDSLVDRRSPLPLDNALVQQTKDQIRLIVESIANLTHSTIEPKVFLGSALAKVQQAMGAVGAAVWQQMPDATWQMVSQIDLPANLLFGCPDSHSQELTTSPSSFEQLDYIEHQLQAATGPEQIGPEQTSASAEPAGGQNFGTSKREVDVNHRQPSAAHQRILNAVAHEKQPILIPPGDVSVPADRPNNPTSHVLMYAPLSTPKGVGNYWLQVVQAPSGGPSSQRGYLRFVAQMADLLSDYFRSYRLRIFERDREWFRTAERTMDSLSSAVETKRGLSDLMGSIRNHVEAEHTFLLYRRHQRGRWRVMAAAGLVDIDRRASGIEQIERVATHLQASFPVGGSFAYEHSQPGEASLDTEIAQFMTTFSAIESSWIKPILSKPLQADSRQAIAHRIEPGHQDVAILVTWSRTTKPSEHSVEQCALLCRLGLSALQVPWWRSALFASTNTSGLKSIVGRWPRVAKSLIAIALIATVLAIPVPMKLQATAVLIPTDQQQIYAPWDAIVDKVFVEHGQVVKTGDPILQLTSPALTAEYEQAVGQQLRIAQRFNEIDGRLLRETSLSPVQRDELEGERETILAVRQIEQETVARLKSQLDSMQMVAEIDGTVATWNVKNNLRDRPVRTGQWLMSIHQKDSEWVLEAAMSEQYASELQSVLKNQQEAPIATMTGDPNRSLPVRFSVRSTPRIDSSVAMSGNAMAPNQPDAVLRLRFDVDVASLPQNATAPGSTARISIPNGRGPLGWALSKDFVRRAIAKIRLWI
jgi:multidrug efflux pump subunit AcrA (membrane-fusion protein)